MKSDKKKNKSGDVFDHLAELFQKREIELCPFCGSDDIKYSNKTMGDRSRNMYGRRKVAMYCNNCNVYGPRTIVAGDSYNGSANEGYDEALRNWNTRRRL